MVLETTLLCHSSPAKASLSCQQPAYVYSNLWRVGWWGGGNPPRGVGTVGLSCQVNTLPHCYTITSVNCWLVELSLTAED